MTYYYGKYKNSYGFLHSDIHQIEDHHIELTDEEYNILLYATNVGAKIYHLNDKLILKDYRGNQIHLHQVKKDSYFGEPTKEPSYADMEELWIREQIQYGNVMGEKFSQEMKEYVKTIRNLQKTGGQDKLQRPDKIFE